jgi:hypothetical protein
MKKKTIKIDPSTVVKVTKKSRALLERAHKDGIVKMYPNTFACPEEDIYWCYFTPGLGGEWARVNDRKVTMSVEELENILYPKPQVTFSDTIINLINQEIERVGIENVTPLEKALLKTLGIYPPKEIKVYDKGKHVATVTKDKVSISAGDYSKDIIFKLKTAYEKVK